MNNDEMMIDAEIRRVTKPGANVFLELGFAPGKFTIDALVGMLSRIGKPVKLVIG